MHNRASYNSVTSKRGTELIEDYSLCGLKEIFLYINAHTRSLDIQSKYNSRLLSRRDRIISFDVLIAPPVSCEKNKYLFQRKSAPTWIDKITKRRTRGKCASPLEIRSFAFFSRPYIFDGPLLSPREKKTRARDDTLRCRGAPCVNGEASTWESLVSLQRFNQRGCS